MTLSWQEPAQISLAIYGQMLICLSGCSCCPSGTFLWSHTPLKTRPFTSHSKKASPKERGALRGQDTLVATSPIAGGNTRGAVGRASLRAETFRKVSHRGSLFIHSMLWRQMLSHALHLLSTQASYTPKCKESAK